MRKGFHVFCLFCCLAGHLFAYETPTHSDITRQAVQHTILVKDSSLLQDLGVKMAIFDPAFPSLLPKNSESPQPDQTRYESASSIEDIIAGGSVLEDASKNSINHFYDFQHGGNGMAFALPFFSYQFGKASPDWILELDRSGNDLPDPKQSFSYVDALEYFYLALTSKTLEERNKSFGQMFRGLGHVIHHIQDMAQPQHVRNDQHCDKKANALCTPINNPSHYEKYTDAHRELIKFSINENKIPDFPRARDYWDNAGGAGIAEYTANNFVSQGTNFELDRNHEPVASRAFLLPTTVPGSVTTGIRLQDLLIESHFSESEVQNVLEDLNCQQNEDLCEIEFISSPVFESRRVADSTPSINYRASSISMLNDELHKRQIPFWEDKTIVTYNRFNFLAAYPYLIPHAIAYSAGLINHFFRGRIKITGTNTGVNNQAIITVENSSGTGNSFRAGKFELYYDATTGTRNPVAGLQVLAGSLPLPPGAEMQFGFDVPHDINLEADKPYTLVFNALHGQVGVERGIASTRFKYHEQGIVSRLPFVTGECGTSVYAVFIDFREQPANQGRITLQGAESNATLDFTNIPAGTDVIQAAAMWSHGREELGGMYQYVVTYRRPGIGDPTCVNSVIGPWILGEKVNVIIPE